jgi:dephospho-CoA kinase
MTPPNSDCRRAPVVGIVGGLGSGKSTAARMLAERGARVVDADRIVHELLDRAQVREEIREEFGAEVLDEQGRVVPARLADEAFGRPGRVEALNAIVHPPVLEEIRREVERLAGEPEVPLVVLDAALLIETGLDRELCTAVIFVEAPRELRRLRAAARGMDERQFARREQAQAPLEEKRARADYTIENAGSVDELAAELDRLWPELRKGEAQRASANG